MNNENKISIIIPAYNVSLYIKECVESVCKQSYKNLEIIIVDDGSTDNTLEILKEMKKNDLRINLIHKENGGLSSARNAGLKIATGDYIMFLDSDDWLESDCCQDTITKIKENNADLVFFDYFKEYENNMVKHYSYKQDMIYSSQEKPFFLYDMRTITAWGKLYKKEVLENSLFDENMKTAEDVDFNYRFYQKVNKAVYLHKCLLHYRILKKSAIHGYDALIGEKFEYPLNSIKSYATNEELRKAYYSFAAIAYIVICQNNYCLSKDSINEKANKIKRFSENEWVKDLFENIKQIKIPFSRKLIIYLGKLKLYLFIISIVKMKQEMEK